MAEERSPRYEEQMASSEAGQAYAFAQPELLPRFPREEVLTGCQDSLLYLFAERFLDITISTVALVVICKRYLVAKMGGSNV